MCSRAQNLSRCTRDGAQAQLQLPRVGLALSGGGYVGAMYGCLVDTYGAHRAKRLMATSHSPVLGWLRHNMRATASRGCARAITAHVGAPWVSGPDAQAVRLRDLPASLAARAGVMELWLPAPDDTSPEQQQQER